MRRNIEGESQLCEEKHKQLHHICQCDNMEPSISAFTTPSNLCSLTKQWREMHFSILATSSLPFILALNYKTFF